MTDPFALPLEPPARANGIGVKVHGPDTFANREYVTEDGTQYYWPGQRVLDPHTEHRGGLYVDHRLFEEMSRDPKLHKCKRTIIEGVLTDDLQLASGATEEEARDENEFKLFVQVQDFGERVVEGLDEPIWRTYEQMMDLGLEQGHAIAETNWEERLDEPIRRPSNVSRDSVKARKTSGGVRGMFFRAFGIQQAEETVPVDPNAPRPPGPKRKTKILDRPKVRLMPTSIKPKPFGAALFAVDRYMTKLGIVPAWSGYRTTYNAMDVISMDKFLVLTINPRNGDPRGTSVFWPVIEWYSLMRAIPFNYRKYLSQEALPIPILKLPPNSQGWYFVKGPDGEVVTENGRPKFIEAVEAGQITIENMYNGKGVVVPAEVTIDPYEGNASKANVFPQSIDTIGGLMEEAILGQSLAQSATKSGAGSKSQAQVHEGRLIDKFFWYKRILAIMTLYQLIAVAVRINLGQWAIAYLPLVSLGDSVKRDWANDLKVVAQAYFWGFIDDTMRAELCAWLGLPKPGPSRFELGAETGANADVDGNPVVNNEQRPDKQAGQKGRNDGNSTPKKDGAKKARMSDEEYAAWLDTAWPDGTARTFKSFDEAQNFIEGLRNNVRKFTATTSTGLSKMGHHARSRGSYVGHPRGRASR